jgi:hypothetical protein
MHHPTEREIGEPRLVLGIAAADIGMVPGKPHLVEPVGIFVRTFRALVVDVAPDHPGEISAVLVDGQRMTRVPDPGVEVVVVELHLRRGEVPPLPPVSRKPRRIPIPQRDEVCNARLWDAIRIKTQMA